MAASAKLDKLSRDVAFIAGTAARGIHKRSVGSLTRKTKAA